MSKYADDFYCTCEMQLVTCVNKYHAESCELWNEPTFVDGSDEWDGDLGTLVLNRSPWHNAEDYIWNGDEPVVRKTTAIARQNTTADADMAEVIALWENAAGTPKCDEVVEAELIPEGEQEVLDALSTGSAKVDDVGMVALADGSYADWDARVTYRKIIGDDGAPTWVEELWDTDDCFVSDGPIHCTCLPPTKDQCVCTGGATMLDCVCMPPKKFYCHVCKVQRKTEADEWEPWSGSSYGASSNNGTTTYTSYSWSKCHHSMDTFHLPGKQHRNIKISAKHVHTADNTPDYGLYMYNGWDPKCVATLLPWQDYGLPTVSYVKAAEAIKYAYDLACAGRIVEVGCMGGHGRTGTVLACMAILSDPDMSPEDAVLHVRKVHCNEAVETNQQEWFVKWFAAWHVGGACPPMPTTYVSKHSANWDAAGTAAVAVKAGVGSAPKVMAVRDNTTSLSAGVWCNDCKRTVRQFHNKGCPFDTITLAPIEAVEPPLTFDTALYTAKGETANARRRNAKRHNRRKARKHLMRTGD